MLLLKRCTFCGSFPLHRGISMSVSSELPFKGPPNKPLVETKEGRYFNRKMNPERFKEVVLAQRRRRPWEYPVMPDQRASFKHQRWLDPMARKWLETKPKIPRWFNLSYKAKRERIFEAANINELLYFLLDTRQTKKYIIPAFDDKFPQVNMSYFYQYLTHSKYVHGLPLVIDRIPVDENKFNDFKNFIRETLLMRNYNVLYANKENPFERKTRVDNDVMRSIMTYLVSSQPELSNCEVAHDVETSMYWLRGTAFWRYTQPNDVATVFQSEDSALLQVRTEQPLPPFSTWLGELSSSRDGEIPTFEFTPYVFGNKHIFYRNRIIPGHRPFGGDVAPNYDEAYFAGKLDELPPPVYPTHIHGHTQVRVLPPTRGIVIAGMEKYSNEAYRDNLEHCDVTGEIEEHLKAYGIMAGWTWTAAQATYSRHWMDNDVTRPFCSQVIAFDGKRMSVFCYQLNTLAIDAQSVVSHERANLCYGRTNIQLYDDITTDDVIGLNDDALRLLMKLAANSSGMTSSDDDMNQHDAGLTLQHFDSERPGLEHQKPLHKMQREAELELASRLERERVELEMNLKDKLKMKFKSVLNG